MNKYQNVTYNELLSYSNNNPNRTRALDSIEIPIQQEKYLTNIGLNKHITCNLNPSGIIGLISCINDTTYYSLASVSTRTQLIIDLTTQLQQKTNELKNTSISRKRKKISELISAVYNGTRLEEKDHYDLFNGISIMCNIQFILIKSAIQETIEEGTVQSGVKGEILFSSNPSNWKHDTPLWIVDYHARWVAIPLDTQSDSIHIASWLTDIEQTGWIIKWPEVDIPKTELVEHLSQLPTWKETDRKLTKDILSVRLGRANCIKVFTKWMN